MLKSNTGNFYFPLPTGWVPRLWRAPRAETFVAGDTITVKVNIGFTNQIAFKKNGRDIGPFRNDIPFGEYYFACALINDGNAVTIVERK